MRITQFSKLIVLTLMSMLFSSQMSFSQDSTQYVQYDVIYMKDGRILKGEIMSYDEQFGGISFKDPYGKMYNIGRNDYDYFKENVNFPVKPKKNKPVHPRKEDGFGFNIGLGMSYVNMNQETTADDYFVQDSYGNADIPITLSIEGGKYFSRRHFVGLKAEYGLIGDEPGYLGAGARYVYQYDAAKTNTALYFPIEVKYQQLNMLTSYKINDTIWYDASSYSYPGSVYSLGSFSNLGISIGHGIGFVMKGGRSINVEMSYTKLWILSVDYKDPIPGPHEPKSTFTMGTFRLGMFYSF